MKIPFVGQSYTLRSTNLGAQRSVNWYPEFTPDGQNVIALQPRPGLVSVVSRAGVRGGDSFNGVGYFVAGNKFYSFDGTTETERGTLLTSSGPVWMAFNGVQVMVTDGTYGYIYTLATNAFAQITDVDFLYPGPVTYINSYFIASDPNTAVAGQSAVFDGLSWGALDFAAAESSPDNLVRPIADHDELVMFGGKTIEFWYNDAGTDFSFSRYIGAQAEVGLASPSSVSKLDEGLLFLGDDGIVYRLEGRQPIRISTHAVEFALNSYSSLAGAYAFNFEWDGHKFFCLSSEDWDTTWVYDIATGSWWEASTWTVGRWDVVCCFELNNQRYVGTSAGISRLDDVPTDNGGIMERKRTTQLSHEDHKLIFFHTIELLMEPGQAALNTNPQVMLSWSDDGGHTWSNEVFASIGLTGEYGWRVYWHRLGASRARIWRVRITDAVKTVLIGANAEAKLGRF